MNNKYEIDELSLNAPLSQTTDAETIELSPAQTKLVFGHAIPYNLRMLSHSSCQTLHSCSRKYELNKLLPRARQDDSAGHLAFGTVVGNGIQAYCVSKSINKAMMRVFLDWDESIDSDLGEKSAKTFWHAIRGVQKFVDFHNIVLSEYEVAYFGGRPAIELGFDIDFGDGFHYRGKIDVLLIHKIKKTFLILECKTTGYPVVDEAMYKNSGQALGYGLVVDRIAHDLELANSYDVLYPVYKTRDMEWTFFRFPKSNTQRALWLQSILYDCSHISQYYEMEYFPLNGDSCFSFNRQCPHFGLCTLSNDILLNGEAEIKLDKEGDYPFKFDIGQLIEAQVSKV